MQTVGQVLHDQQCLVALHAGAQEHDNVGVVQGPQRCNLPHKALLLLGAVVVNDLDGHRPHPQRPLEHLCRYVCSFAERC